MKKSITLFAITILSFFVLINHVSADISFWRDISLDYNNSIVTSYGVYNFIDESKEFLGKYRAIPIGIMYDWNTIPVNISQYYPQYQNALVDWCHLTISHDIYDYDDEGNFINSSTEEFTFNATSIPLGNNLSVFFMKHRDSLRIRWDCHYTNPQTLFIDGVVFADWGTFFPAFSCSGCEEFKLEELAKEIEYQQVQAEKEISIYQKIQKIVGLNMTLWTIFSWIVKIGLILGSVGLIFLSGYFFYSLIMNLAGREA
jgi:hypothetical protein